MKKIVQRMCIGCNEKKDKRELIRIVLNKQGEISIDRTGKLEGRGTYICDNIDCLEKAIKNKKLEKSFDIKIDEQIYEQLRGVIIEN
ncbi:MAG: YlxR family protein [Clostridia bacterium]|nr:YlxR family protein [Clostridia bacterium]